MKKILILGILYVAAIQSAVHAQSRNHLTTNLFSPLSSKKNVGLTYHREFNSNLGLQISVFYNFKLGQKILKNDEFIPEFKYTFNKNALNLGGECTFYFYKNRIGVYAGYEKLHVNKQERFCVEATDLGNGFVDCKEIHAIDYKDGINIVQTGFRVRIPLPIEPGHLSFHIRPVYAYFWNDRNQELPDGPDMEGRSQFSKNIGHWNNNLLFYDRGSFLSIKLEVHAGISW